jgi:hypothetical protein
MNGFKNIALAILLLHLYILGGTGSGKSRLIEGIFMQLAQSGEGVGVLDPHGELFDNLVARIASTRNKALWDRVVILNPLDRSYIPGFNPLEIHPGEIIERKSRFLADVITKIWRADPLITARMQRMMYFAFWLLATFWLTLVELPMILTNKEFRQALLTCLQETHPLRLYWEVEFPKNPRTITEWTQSTLNKAGSLANDPDLALLFGQRKSTVNFQKIMERGYILLANLSKGMMGGIVSHMFGGFLMAQIQQSALARANSPHQNHRQFTLFVDEFQNYTTDNIQEILAESRKYKLSLVMAHQYREQLDANPELKQAVLNTVGNYACFRVGYTNAREIAPDIFQPDIDQVKDIRLRYQEVEGVQEEFVDYIYRGQDEIWENEIRKLIQLKNREFWYKRRGPYPPVKLRSLYLPDIQVTPQLERDIEALVALSNSKWSRPKSEVQREIERRERRLLKLAYEENHPKRDGRPPIFGSDPST